MAFDPTDSHRPAADVFFERRELDEILRLYGRMVAAGEWRDYAMGGLPHKAVFCVFKRTGENPLYRIEKEPALARRQGAWCVKSQHGLILRRGHDLTQVLRIFDKRRLTLVE